MEKIKGMCESCGFFYAGTMETNNGVFREIKCNKCGKQTDNFDSAKAVDALNKAEGDTFDYEEVELQYVS